VSERSESDGKSWREHVRKTYESNATIFLSFSPHRCEFIEAIEEGSRHLLVGAIRIIDPRSNGVFFSNDVATLFERFAAPLQI
jgi:hypothetical protein